jgi:hypothetical protein
MIIEIREEARGDLHTGYRFYEDQAAGLGRYFLECSSSWQATHGHATNYSRSWMCYRNA